MLAASEQRLHPSRPMPCVVLGSALRYPWGESFHFIGGNGRNPSEIAILRTFQITVGQLAQTKSEVGGVPLAHRGRTAAGMDAASGR